MHIKTPLAVAITLTLAMGAAAPLQAAGQQAVAATGAVAADAVDLDRIEVRAQLESQIRAVDLKRGSDAIEDAVSSDALGQYPDKNVAESLQRLPGISVTRDQGEGRFVVIRGLDANLNSVSVDGIAVGTPEDSSRAAPLDVIPSDSTERLLVVKSPTPDMPGDAIGGAVLVESASAFDRDGRSLRGKIEGSHQQLSGETSPKAAFNYSEVFNDTFGVALGVNYQKRRFESDNTEVEYDGEDDAAPGDVTAINLQHRKYEIERKRIGANLNLDWRPDEDSRYYLRTLYSQFDDAETRQRVIFNFDDAKMVKTGTDQYRLDGMPKDSIDKRMRYRTKKENTFAASLGGENKLTNAVVDYRIGYTRTEERVNDEMEARFKLNGKAFNGSLDQSSRLPSYSFDNPQWLDNSNYAFDRFVLSPKQVNDKEHSAQVNVRFDGDSSSIKFGLLGLARTSPRQLRRRYGFGCDACLLGSQRQPVQRPPAGRRRQCDDVAGRGLRGQRGHLRQLCHGYLGRGCAAHHRRRARGEHPLQGDRQPGGRGRQRPQLHRHPARGQQQLHQRAAGPAPAL